MSGAPVEIIALRKAFAFGGRPIEVLKGIDLSIKAGEMVAVVGASGAGKSTFLHVLGTLDVVSSGKVVIDGADVTSPPFATTRSALFFSFITCCRSFLPSRTPRCRG